MKLNKMARKINRELFNNKLDLGKITFNKQKNLVDDSWIAGITYAFKTDSGERISVVYILTKHCKKKKFTLNVLAHELVHCYQNQLRIPLNHNGAFMRYYCRKAKTIGYQIDIKEF